MTAKKVNTLEWIQRLVYYHSHRLSTIRRQASLRRKVANLTCVSQAVRICQSRNPSLLRPSHHTEVDEVMSICTLWYICYYLDSNIITLAGVVSYDPLYWNSGRNWINIIIPRQWKEDYACLFQKERAMVLSITYVWSPFILLSKTCQVSAYYTNYASNNVPNMMYHRNRPIGSLPDMKHCLHVALI